MEQNQIIAAFVGISIAIGYFFYTRVYLVHQNLKFYEQQGAHVLPGSYKWVVGCLNGLLQYEQAKSEGKVPGVLPDDWILANVPKWSGVKSYVREQHKVKVWQILNDTTIYLCDPPMVQDLVMKHARILSKVSQPGKFMFPATLEDQILSMENCKAHVQRRKDCLRNFTSDTAELMMQTLHECAGKWAADMKKSGRKTFELRNELTKNFQVMLSIYILGEDISHHRFEVHCDDKDGNITCKQMNWLDGVQEALSQSVLNYKFTRLIGKSIKVTPLQRAEDKNWTLLIDWFAKYVQNRRKSPRDEKSTEPRMAVIDTLLDSYESDDALMQDLVIIFVAGLDSIRNESTSAMYHLVACKDSHRKLKDELDTLVFNKGDDAASQIKENVTLASIKQMKFLDALVREALRNHEAIFLAEEFRLREDAQIGEYQFKKGAKLIVDIGGMHKDPKEWQRPSEFLPQRFDEDDPLFLTPGGQQRHKMSYAPFSHGRRNCIGQYFAYHAIKVMIIHMVSHFDLEFVEERFQKDAKGCPEAQLFRVIPYPIELRMQQR